MTDDNTPTMLEMVDELAESADTPEVELLVQLLREEIRRSQWLERRVESHADRLTRLEAATGVNTPEPTWEQPAFDNRDQRVLRTITERDSNVLSVKDIHALYRKRTDIRNSQTLRDRTQTLVEEGPFEQAGQQKWRWVGPETES